MKISRKKRAKRGEGSVPAQLPPVEGLDSLDPYAPGHRPQTWLWTLLTALVVVMMVVYLLVLGTKAIYDGLRDRCEALVRALRPARHTATERLN